MNGAPRTWQSMRRRGLMVVAGATALATLMAGCSRGSTDTGSATTDSPSSTSAYINPVVSDEQPTLGGSLVYGLNADTNSWNPALAQWASYSMIEARTMFEFLTEFDKDGVVRPYVAESLTPNGDYTEWTVKLRDGIKWSTGEPMTAQQVADSLEFVRSSPVVGKGIRLIEETDEKTGTDGFTVLDRLTFKVHMEKPWATFPQGMLSQLGALAHPEWLESDRHFNPVGSGPFFVESWTQDKAMVVKKNPHYWRKDKWGNAFPYLDSIEFRIIPDEQERANALRSGEVDIMLQTLATPDVSALRKEAEEGKFQSFSDDQFETAEDHIVLNTKLAPFDDPDARRALAHAIDVKEYVSTITGGLNSPADSSLAPNSPWYSATDYPTYDPAKARELVEKVKAKNGGTFEFSLTTQNTPEAARILQFVTEQWAEVGITAKPNYIENRSKIIGMVSGSNQATISQLFDAPFPLNDAVFWPGQEYGPSDLGISFARLADPKLVELYEQANGSNDPAVQRSAQAEIQKQLARQVPFVWLAHVSRTIVASTNLVNVVNHTLPDGEVGLDFMQGSHALYQIWRQR